MAMSRRETAWQCPPTFSYSPHSLLKLLPIRLVICSHVRSLSVTFLPYMCASVAGLTAAGVADKMIAGGGVQRLPLLRACTCHAAVYTCAQWRMVSAMVTLHVPYHMCTTINRPALMLFLSPCGPLFSDGLVQLR